MPAWSEISSSLYGVWRLARMDRGGMNYLNLSTDGFWRSFFAAALAAPTYVFILLIQHARSGEELTWLAEIASFVLGWTLWPVAVLLLCRLMGLTSNFIPYIIAYNWANVLHINFLLLMAILTHGNVLPDGMAIVIGLASTIAVLVYLWWIARVALGASVGVAMGIVVLDILLGMSLSQGAANLFA